MQIRASPAQHLITCLWLKPKMSLESPHKIINVISQNYTNNNITTIHKHPFNITGSLWGQTELNLKYLQIVYFESWESREKKKKRTKSTAVQKHTTLNSFKRVCTATTFVLLLNVEIFWFCQCSLIASCNRTTSTERVWLSKVRACMHWASLLVISL